MGQVEKPESPTKAETPTENKQKAANEVASVEIDDEMQFEMLARETADALEAVKIQKRKLQQAKTQLERAKNREKAYGEYLQLNIQFDKALKAYESQPREESNDAAEGIVNNIIRLLKERFGEDDRFLQAKLTSLNSRKWKLVREKFAFSWDRTEAKIDQYVKEGDTEGAKSELRRLVESLEGNLDIDEDGSIKTRLDSVKKKWGSLRG